MQTANNPPGRSSRRILTQDEVNRKLNRLVYQLIEDQHNIDAPFLLAGISGNGSILARRIGDLLGQRAPHHACEHLEIQVDKKKPTAESTTLVGNAQLEGRTVTLVDDVLNTGRTMAFAMLPFMARKIDRLRMMVLVNRDHLSFPLAPDYVGMSLATQHNEHIEVVFDQHSGQIESFLLGADY